MSLEVLVIMVVAGVSLVFAVVAWSGVSHPVLLDSEDQARDLLRSEFPEAKLGEGLLSGDRKAAFFRCGNDRIAVAAAFGDRFVLRLYERSAFRHLTVKEDGGANVRFNDFTFPSLRLRFASKADAGNLSGWLEENDASLS
jgi:hypothetical protein